MDSAQIMKVMWGVLIGIGAIVWLYVAARVITRAVVRTLKERREKRHG